MGPGRCDEVRGYVGYLHRCVMVYDSGSYEEYEVFFEESAQQLGEVVAVVVAVTGAMTDELDALVYHHQARRALNWGLRMIRELGPGSTLEMRKQMTRSYRGGLHCLCNLYYDRNLQLLSPAATLCEQVKQLVKLYETQLRLHFIVDII